MLVINVRNANGAPVFDPVETWNVLEGQALRISVFAFDPDNPGFEPKLRLTPTGGVGGVGGVGGALTGGDGTAASVSYEVSGLPAGASFDADTLELVWTPGYAQAGSYLITVTATDNGDGTGTPLSSQITLPIVVTNANRAPQIGDLTNAFVDRGAVLDIPISATDADGNPLTITVQGLPPFASYTQTASIAGGSAVTGVIHFAPGAHPSPQARGDYTVTVVVQDNGDGDINQVAVQAKSFVVTVRSPSEAPVVTVPSQVVAVIGQTLMLPILGADLDQDALRYAAQGLPAGATIVVDPQYGHASIVWTPTAAQAGSHDFSLEVSDSGLPPADAGFVPDPAHPPVPNTTVTDLRIVVRAANAAPSLIAVSASGGSISGDALAGKLTTVNVDEGVPLALELSAQEPDLDRVNWTVAGLLNGQPNSAGIGLPPGMVAEPGTGAVANRG